MAQCRCGGASLRRARTAKIGSDALLTMWSVLCGLVGVGAYVYVQTELGSKKNSFVVLVKPYRV